MDHVPYHRHTERAPHFHGLWWLKLNLIWSFCFKLNLRAGEDNELFSSREPSVYLITMIKCSSNENGPDLERQKELGPFAYCRTLLLLLLLLVLVKTPSGDESLSGWMNEWPGWTNGWDGFKEQRQGTQKSLWEGMRFYVECVALSNKHANVLLFWWLWLSCSRLCHSALLVVCRLPTPTLLLMHRILDVLLLLLDEPFLVVYSWRQQSFYSLPDPNALNGGPGSLILRRVVSVVDVADDVLFIFHPSFST